MINKEKPSGKPGQAPARQKAHVRCNQRCARFPKPQVVRMLSLMFPTRQISKMVRLDQPP